MPTISLIAAIGKRTRALGKDGDLIWKIREDMQRFIRLTKGHPILMGRRTWESLPVRPLKNRINIIVSKTLRVDAKDTYVFPDLKAAIALAMESAGMEEIFIIGGERMYRDALPFANRLYLTLVDDDTAGDVYFPPYDAFKKVIEHDERESEGYRYTFLTLERG